MAEKTYECLLCKEQKNESCFDELPCCKENTEVCRSCLATALQEPLQEPSEGECPRCRTLVRVVSIEREEQPPWDVVRLQLRIGEIGRCPCCGWDGKVLVPPDYQYCASCNEGTRSPFVYECRGCGGQQNVPFPLYKDQRGPENWCGPSWACHGRCYAQRTWRLVQEQIDSVPPGTAPTSWGQGLIRNEMGVSELEAPGVEYEPIKFESEQDILSNTLTVKSTSSGGRYFRCSDFPVTIIKSFKQKYWVGSRTMLRIKNHRTQVTKGVLVRLTPKGSFVGCTAPTNELEEGEFEVGDVLEAVDYKSLMKGALSLTRKNFSIEECSATGWGIAGENARIGTLGLSGHYWGPLIFRVRAEALVSVLWTDALFLHVQFDTCDSKEGAEERDLKDLFRRVESGDEQARMDLLDLVRRAESGDEQAIRMMEMLQMLESGEQDWNKGRDWKDLVRRGGDRTLMDLPQQVEGVFYLKFDHQGEKGEHLKEMFNEKDVGGLHFALLG